MFTIREIDFDGAEHIREVSVVHYQPAFHSEDVGKPGQVSLTPERLLLVLPDGSMDFAERGDFFVMNESGKTVAAYHLRPTITTSNQEAGSKA